MAVVRDRALLGTVVVDFWWTPLDVFGEIVANELIPNGDVVFENEDLFHCAYFLLDFDPLQTNWIGHVASWQGNFLLFQFLLEGLAEILRPLGRVHLSQFLVVFIVEVKVVKPHFQLLQGNIVGIVLNRILQGTEIFFKLKSLVSREESCHDSQ